MATLQGADLAGLDSLSRDLRRQAGTLRALNQRATGDVTSLRRLWAGADSAQFSQLWMTRHRVQLNRAVDELLAAAATVERNRDAQEQTSIADGFGGGGSNTGVLTNFAFQQGGPGGSSAEPDLPPFPPEPPAPTSGDGSGEHGSKGRNWFQDRWDDTQRAMWFEVADAADALGLDNASRHMRHYLGNSGDDLVIDPDEMLHDLPGLADSVEQTIEFDLQDMIAEQIDADYDGEPLTFQVTTDWEGYYAGKSESEDWFFGLGGFSYAVGAEVTVTPGPNGEPIVEVAHQTHVFDRYNWDENKSVNIGPFNVSDESLGHLHEVGRAQEYDVRGSSDVETFTYEYTGGPDNPDGGGSPAPVEVEGQDDGRDRTDDPSRNDDRSRRSGDREGDRYR